MKLSLPVEPETLQVVARIDHYRGSWGAGTPLPADRLERLRDAARARSVAASCRLAGIRVHDAEVAALLQDPSAPCRDRREVLGVARALDWPGLDRAPLLDTEALRRLHAIVAGADLDDPQPSPWRKRSANREAFSSDGTALGRVFQTLPHRMIAETMNDLLAWFEIEIRAGRQHPLLVIGAFTLAFLAASPFERANGRVSRILAVRLLERAGYGHVRYASVERVIEDSREDYYEAYDRAETRLWTGEADLGPWLRYFLGTLDEQRRRLQAAVHVESRAMNLSPLQRLVLDTLGIHGSADAALLLSATGANRNTLKDNMRRLVGMGLVEKTGERRGTRYRLAATTPFDAPAAGPQPASGTVGEAEIAPAPMPPKPIDH